MMKTVEKQVLFKSFKSAMLPLVAKSAFICFGCLNPLG
jgi:hypothetical protein